jgi:hypothetical protein
MTRYRSAIITESRLQHAALNGFCITDLYMTTYRHATLLCKHSLEPELVLTQLRLHGVFWDSVMCNSAALVGRQSLLQWLHSEGCWWIADDVLSNASRSGSVPLLQRLGSVTKP